MCPNYPPTPIPIVELSSAQGVVIHDKIVPRFLQVEGQVPLATRAGGVISLLDGQVGEDLF